MESGGSLSSSNQNNSSNGSRGVCRYFSTKGECYYGSDCQYLHQNPNRITSDSTSSSSMIIPAESKLSKWLPMDSSNNGGDGGGHSSHHHHSQHHHSKPGTGGMKFPSGPGSRGQHASYSGLSHHQQQHPHHHSSHMSSNNSFMSAASGGYQRMSHQTALNASPSSASSSTGHQMIAQTHIPLPTPSFFVTEELRLELLRKQMIHLSQGNSHPYNEIPIQVESYQDLCPIEENSGLESSFFYGFQSSVFKATSMKTGEVVCLRRIHSYSPSASNYRPLQFIVENWKKVVHTNLTSLRGVFATKDFGDSSLVFVYDYFPASQTLFSQYFRHSVNASNVGGINAHNGVNSSSSGVTSSVNKPYSQQQTTKLLPEALIWSYIIQLSSVLRHIHSQSLAYRCLDASKVIMTSGLLPDPMYITNQALQQQVRQQPRLKLSSCCIPDVLFFDQLKEQQQSSSPAASRAMILQYQQEDLFAFGQLILSLASNCLIFNNKQQDKWQSCLDIVHRNYSGDLRSLILHLLSIKGSSSPQTRSINDIMPMIGGRFYNHIDVSYQRMDIMEQELMKELDNSRLFRLICKLNCITERPEHRLDPQWSETGDRYLVKLFRDFLFHQVSGEGRPWMDLGHVITHVNKMEQGSLEKVCLVSRDEQNVLIVTYAEIKKCFDSSFNDLLM